MDIRRVPIEQVEPWEKNPRGITKADFKRLKRQIEKLGVYKPLICAEENGRFITLGGNMRIRALQELGHKEVDISVVRAEAEEQKIEYALSDNDRAGYYEEDKLAELVYPHVEDIRLEDFKVDVGEPIDLKGIIERFGPDIGGPHLSLAERFIIPPFSVFDARQGYWQERKEAWLRLGIQSELGRGGEDRK